MLKGRFGATSGRPYIEACVVFPRLKSFGNLSFILDTGADKSLLMPLDGQRLGIEWDKLDETDQSSGIGGHLECYIEPAIVVFASAEKLYLYSIKLWIYPQSQEIVKIPSLLGRDLAYPVYTHTH